MESGDGPEHLTAIDSLDPSFPRANAMQAKEAIKFLLESNQNMIGMYLSDLSDADLLVRPTPGANHIAWQLGHLIIAEVNFFMPKVPGAKPAPLPPGFAKQHSKDTINSDSGFKTKDEYLKLFNSYSIFSKNKVNLLIREVKAISGFSQTKDCAGTEVFKP